MQNNRYMVSFDKQLRQILASMVNNVLSRKKYKEFTTTNHQNAAAAAAVRTADARLTVASETSTIRVYSPQIQPMTKLPSMQSRSRDFGLNHHGENVAQSNLAKLSSDSKRHRRYATDYEKYTADDIMYAREPIVKENTLLISVFMDQNGMIMLHQNLIITIKQPQSAIKVTLKL